MEYKLDLGAFNGVFAVPNSIVDEYIKIATGDNLKVLLYCLRHSGQGLSAGEISRATGIPPDNVTSSLDFWKQRVDNIAESEPAGVLPATSAEGYTPSPAAILDRDYDFSPKEICDTIKNSKDVDYLFQRCEGLYGRPLKHTEMKALAVIIEEVGMKPEVALMLMEHCFSIGKTTPAYIKKTAKDWIEQGINSLALADEEIKRFKEYHSEEGKIKQMLNVRDIPEAKKPLLKKWLYEQHHSNETIYAAYQKTLEKTGKLEYTYMDKILSGDQTNKSASAKTAVSQPSFNLEELDKQIMEGYKKGLI